MEKFDAIVVGTGGVGSATLLQLAKRGLRVLGIDRFPMAHANGSSHGQSRIIRQAYFEHPDYVPLLLRAYALWNEVQQAAECQLFHNVGLLEVGPRDGVLIPGVMRSAAEHNLPIEILDYKYAKRTFPFALDEGNEIIFEPTAGYLLVEQCVQSHLELAIRSGARWRQERVLAWNASHKYVEVQTELERYQAERLVICGGAWSAELLVELGVEFGVLQKHQYWFDVASNHASPATTYFFETPFGAFYGFPEIANQGLKVAQHSGGRERAAAVALPDLKDPEDELAVRGFVERCLPFCSGRLRQQAACMYTMSPDHDFVVDHHPAHENVVFAAGLSGHGFKFATVLGEVLADLVTANPSEMASTHHATDFLGLSRFGL